MNWNKLKEKKCPRCDNRLELSTPYIDEFRCSGSHCLFKIKEGRFEEIVSSLYKKEDREVLKDNLEELNNLSL